MSAKILGSAGENIYIQRMQVKDYKVGLEKTQETEKLGRVVLLNNLILCLKYKVKIRGLYSSKYIVILLAQALDY